MNLLSESSIGYITEKSIYTLGILLVAVITRVIVGIFIKKLVKKLEDDDPNTISDVEQRTQTLASLSCNISNVFIYGGAFMMMLSSWGINIAPILTGAGIIGLAVGFGTQTLVKDIVTGFFILLENQYNVGDRIEIAGNKGVVKEMRLRTTILLGDDGTTYMIPNSSISVIIKIEDAGKSDPMDQKQ